MKLIFVLIRQITLINCANILAIFQYPYYSHQYLYSKIIQQLALRGHNVTVFTSHLINYDQQNVIQHYFNESSLIGEKYTNMVTYKQMNYNIYEKLLKYENKAFFESTKSEIQHPEMQKIIHESENYKFDVLIMECYFCYLNILAEIYDIPIIFITASEPSTFWHGLMGNDISPAFYSEVPVLPYLHRHLSFTERIKSLTLFLFYGTIFRYNYGLYASEIKRQFPNTIALSNDDISLKRTALLIANTNQAFGHVRPLMPNTIQIGFFHVEPVKEIEDVKLKNFLDKSVNGVIVMSLGSKANTKNLKTETIHKFLNAFNKTSFNVLWKFDKNDLEIPENVMCVDWLPLSDVLAHPNVKTIINHAGLLTAYEAIDREVPMIVFPLAYDQGANARMMTHNEVAIEMDLNDFTEDELLAAINKVTKNENFKEKIKKLRKNVYNQPISSRELAIWHIENVMKNKNDLKIYTSHYDEQYKRYFLDIIFSGFAVLCMTCLLMIMIQKSFKAGRKQKLMKHLNKLFGRFLV